MFCNNCGAQLGQNARFCGQCGHDSQSAIPKACEQCGSELEEGSRFCDNCGTQVAQKAKPADGPVEDPGVRGKAKTVKHYPGKARYVRETAEKVQAYLKGKNLDTQLITSTKECMVQGRQHAVLKKLLAMDIAATVTIAAKGDDLRVEIGAGKWLDKAAGAAVAWFLFWPAILTTGWGAYMQQQLFVGIDRTVREFLESKY